MKKLLKKLIRRALPIFAGGLFLMISNMTYASGYVISGTGWQSTNDGFVTNITTFTGGASHDTVWAGTVTQGTQTTDCNFTTPQERLSAVWRVRANSAGTVSGIVIFHFSDYGLSIVPGNQNYYLLLYRPHGSLSGTAWTCPGSGTVGGDSVYFGFTIPVSDIDITLGTIDTVNSPLPVSLTSFNANKVEQEVTMNWNTASEQNNAYFSVERSIDANTWQAIGQVSGHGTTNLKQTYYYRDNLMGFLPIATMYYRLKQVDFNGKFTYSMIRAVRFNNLASSLIAYPNPVIDKLNVNWESLTSESIILQLVNTSGVTVFRENIIGNQKQIDLSEIPAGTYYLQRVTNSNADTIIICKE